MNFWNPLTSSDQLQQIKSASTSKPVVIFKHSTRCSISIMALDRFNRHWKNEYAEVAAFYYLDLLNYRNISNQIATEFDVEHQSPQVLLIEGGICSYSETHQAIKLDEVVGRILPKSQTE